MNIYLLVDITRVISIRMRDSPNKAAVAWAACWEPRVGWRAEVMNGMKP